METKDVLTTASQVVGFLFVAFSGFLTNIAPPESDADFAIGLSSFLALIVLLAAKALSTSVAREKYLKAWFAVAFLCFIVAAVGGVWYRNNLETLTFPFPPGNARAEYVKGSEMTPLARDYQARTGRTDAEVLAAFEGLANREKVWTAESIRRSRQLLTVTYVVFVVSLAGAIFALTEGTLSKATPRPRKRRRQVVSAERP
jgi:hypothetical protein